MAMSSEALEARFGNFGWPILLKELRGDFRRNRFFVTHLVCLTVLGASILVQLAAQSGEAKVQPEQVGFGLFNTFFVIQLLVVLVVFPAFSATAFSEEKAARTFDLLITTDLRPAEIVWGKFLASSIYCLIYVIATVPLLSLSLLFAGVTLMDILIAYLILMGLTVFISMAGVFISSCFSSNIHSTLALYLISFGILAFSWLRWGGLLDFEALRSTILHLRILNSEFDPFPSLLLLGASILGFFALLFMYLFLFTMNRIRPRSDDRSSRIRMLTFVAFLAALLLVELGYMEKALFLERDFQDILAWSAAALFAIACAFSSERADLSRRLRLQFDRWRGLRYPLRIFAPGAFWGLVYTMVLALLTVGFLALMRSQWKFSGLDYGACLAALPLYLFALGSMGFFLAAAGFTPLYTLLTVLSVFIIALLLPVIFQISGVGDGVFSFYYLSPITLWDSLDPSSRLKAEGPRYVVFGVPIIRIAQALFGSLGVLFTCLGVWISRRKGYPLLSFLPRGEPSGK